MYKHFQLAAIVIWAGNISHTVIVTAQDGLMDWVRSVSFQKHLEVDDDNYCGYMTTSSSCHHESINFHLSLLYFDLINFLYLLSYNNSIHSRSFNILIAQWSNDRRLIESTTLESNNNFISTKLVTIVFCYR